MIGSWMLYAIAVSVLFTVAAHALERVVAARGRPRRMLWVVAMTLSVALPVASWRCRHPYSTRVTLPC